MIVDLFAGPAMLVGPSRRGHKLPVAWTHKVCPGCSFIYERTEYRTQARCRNCRSRANREIANRTEYRRRYYAANRDKALAQANAWRRNNRDRWLDANRKAKYGIPYGTYDRMLATQGGGCAVCGNPPPADKALHVDHDHETGKVRGLLCDLCNRGLGYFSDSADRLRDAADYLDIHHDR